MDSNEWRLCKFLSGATIVFNTGHERGTGVNTSNGGNGQPYMKTQSCFFHKKPICCSGLTLTSKHGEWNEQGMKSPLRFSFVIFLRFSTIFPTLTSSVPLVWIAEFILKSCRSQQRSVLFSLIDWEANSCKKGLC